MNGGGVGDCGSREGHWPGEMHPGSCRRCARVVDPLLQGVEEVPSFWDLGLPPSFVPDHHWASLVVAANELNYHSTCSRVLPLSKRAAKWLLRIITGYIFTDQNSGNLNSAISIEIRNTTFLVVVSSSRPNVPFVPLILENIYIEYKK